MSRPLPHVPSRSPSSSPFASALFAVTLSACGGPDAEVRQPTKVPLAPVASTSKPAPPAPVHDDDFTYLEDVTGDRALAFARAHNAVSEKALTSQPGFRKLEQRLFAIYSSEGKIPAPSAVGDKIRNFWTDADHPRGLWRTTTFADYKKPSPSWTTLLDVDALGRDAKVSYVFKGTTCLLPQRTSCMVRLSRGGADANVAREFDVGKRAFVANGFEVPEGKTRVSWKDANTLYVGADFGPGSLTKSGYPRTAREWKRGTALGSAPQIFEGKETDVSVGCERDLDHGRVLDFCARSIDFEHTEVFLRQGGKLVRIDKPDDADAEVWDGQLLLRLRSGWDVGGASFPKGSLIATDLDRFLKGERKFERLFEPTEHASLDSFVGTKSRLLINVLDDVKNKVTIFARQGGKWVGKPLAESASAIQVSPFDDDKSDDAWLWVADFTVPDSLVLFNVVSGKRQLLKQSPSFFDAKGLEVTQHFAASKDGTRVPYFEVGRKERSGPSPTLITAYGGFEISLPAVYSGTVGAAWLEHGGVFVQANLRGGGEYGPAWHEAAMKHNRQNAYDDMAAVAEDLIRRGVTTPKQLGAIGGSNGGLLTSVMLTQRPELFGAIVSRVPLTDMKRFHKLLAGASWMGEYGDPDNEADWAALAKYSPFHNIRRGAKVPPVLYTTSTRDDRVHPAHARKMVAKLEALGYRPLYYENIEGGHGGAADIRQQAYLYALAYTFLAHELGLQ